ncbi:S-layer homology domain-containing protein [Pseudoflavonifractor phocaeensis]|nr:S-layer homology domain-containing protein [Pseudoflavonifractor phocaeensis]
MDKTRDIPLFPSKEVFALNAIFSPRRAAAALLAVLALSLPAVALAASGETSSGEASVSAFAKNAVGMDAITFSADDFRVNAAEGIALDAIVLDSLPDPAAGVLTLAGSPLSAGETVAMSAVDSLLFTPSGGAEQAACFTFTPVFSNGSAGEPVTVDLYRLSSANGAPVAQDLTLSTYRGVALTERFSAIDPEGDLLTFQLVKKPARGAVTLPEDGSDTFTYTPYEGKTGKDTFTYIAMDAVGNTSAPATVTIQIQKPDTKVTYADMDGHPAYNAALCLAAEGVFVGECMGDTYFFQPDAAVTRSQFVAMAMDALDVETLEDVTTTGFADDTSIPLWAKPYVASALRSGLVLGALDSDGQAVFQADSPITRAEATVFLNRLLNITDVSTETFAAAPAWAAQSAANLASCGMLDDDAVLSDTLTRAQAAQLLADAMAVEEERDSGWLSFFSWG